MRGRTGQAEDVVPLAVVRSVKTLHSCHPVVVRDERELVKRRQLGAPHALGLGEFSPLNVDFDGQPVAL